MTKKLLGLAAITAMMMSCSSKGTYTCDCTTTYSSTFNSSNGSATFDVNKNEYTNTSKVVYTEISKSTAEKACANLESYRTDVDSKTGIDKPSQTINPEKKTCTITN